MLASGPPAHPLVACGPPRLPACPLPAAPAAARCPTSSTSWRRARRSVRWCGGRGGGATLSRTPGMTCQVGWQAPAAGLGRPALYSAPQLQALGGWGLCVLAQRADSACQMDPRIASCRHGCACVAVAVPLARAWLSLPMNAAAAVVHCPCYSLRRHGCDSQSGDPGSRVRQQGGAGSGGHRCASWLPACCWLHVLAALPAAGLLHCRVAPFQPRPARLCLSLPALPGSALLLLLASSLALLCLLLCLLAAESLVPEPLQKVASPQEFMDGLHEVGGWVGGGWPTGSGSVAY